MTSLQEAINQCLAAKALPVDYGISSDWNTGTLNVYGPTKSFLISSNAIQEGLIPILFAASLDALIKAEVDGGPIILPLSPNLTASDARP